MPGRYVCITGMHRSGTSAVSQLAGLLGVDLGESRGLISALPGNPAGFYESRKIVRFQQDVLAALGGSWDDPPVLPDGWACRSSLAWARERAWALTSEVFGDASVAGWKDPRTSLLLPLWREAIPLSSSLLVFRDPREVAGSLAARDGLPPERCAYLWLRYTVAAWRDFPGREPFHVDELFRDVDAAAQRLAALLGLPPPDAGTRAAAREAVRPGLRHQRQVVASGPVMQLALHHFGLLCSNERSAYDDAAECLHRRWLSAYDDDRRLRRARTALRPLVHRGVRRRVRIRVGAITGRPARRATVRTSS